MCYSVYLSTDSDEDLSLRNSELVRFKCLDDPNDKDAQDPCLSLLDYPHRWYVGSKAECSCTFRHLYSIELGFSEPVDWYEEEQDQIDATKELYVVLAAILSSGHHCDLVDRWEGAEPDSIKILDVSVTDVSHDAFRLFENHKFRLRKI